MDRRVSLTNLVDAADARNVHNRMPRHRLLADPPGKTYVILFDTHTTGASMSEQNHRISAWFLGILVVTALGSILVLMQSVILPLVVAVFLSYIFKPVVLFLRTKRVPNVVALIVVFILIVAIFLGLGSIVYSSIDTFVKEFPRYQDRFALLIQQISITVERLAAKAGFSIEGMAPSDLIDVSAIGSFVSSGASSLLSFLSSFLMVILLMFFILAGSGDLIAKVTIAFKREQSQAIAAMLKNIDTRMRQYLIAKTFISLLDAGLTTTTLLILGVDFALFWGFLTFLFNFIPSIGSIVAVIFPFIFALLQFDTLTIPMLVLIILGVLQSTVGEVLEPRFMAHSLDLSPLLVLVSLLFWGWMWGAGGMILSVPMMSAIKILCENVDVLNPVAVLMSNGEKPKKR